MKKIFLILCLFFLMPLATSYVNADNRYHVGGFDDDAAVEGLANDFKKAVIYQDKDKVASMIWYPVEATFGDKEVVIRNEEEFLKWYDDIFDRKLCDKIATASTKNLFTNYQGVMLGDGDVWFGNKDGKVRVTAVGACRVYDDPDIK